MRRDIGVLFPQSCALYHPKTVLLVNNRQTKTAELHRVLNERMSADNNVKRSIEQPAVYLITLFCRSRSCKERNRHSRLCRQRTQSHVVLAGKNFGWRHHACLCAVVKSNQHRHKCDEGFSATDIPLKQTIHLTSGIHVAAYLFYNPLLCTCKFKRKTSIVEVIENLPYSRKSQTLQSRRAFAAISLNVKLEKKQLFIFHPLAGSFKHTEVIRAMHLPQRIFQRHEIVFCHNARRKYLWHISDCRQCRSRPCHEISCRHPASTQCLGKRIDTPQAYRSCYRLGKVDFRMNHAPTTVELPRLTKQHIFRADTIGFPNLTCTPEPNDIHRA